MSKKIAPRKRMTRREQRDLDIEIGFMERVVQRDPTYIEALEILGDDYARRGRHAESLKIDQSLALLQPGDPDVLYNLACSYCLIDHWEMASATLLRAIKAGYEDFGWLLQDPDLATLRAHSSFKAVQDKMCRHPKLR